MTYKHCFEDMANPKLKPDDVTAERNNIVL